jgi:hypothetical protein
MIACKDSGLSSVDWLGLISPAPLALSPFGDFKFLEFGGESLLELFSGRVTSGAFVDSPLDVLMADVNFPAAFELDEPSFEISLLGLSNCG